MEVLGDSFGQRARKEPMRGRVLRVVHTQQRSPARIRIGVWIAVGIGARDRGSRPPGPKKVLGIEAGDKGIGGRGMHQGEEPRRLANVQPGADGQVDEVAVPVHVRVLRPEVRDVGLLGRANRTSGSPEVSRFNKIPGIASGGQGIGPAGSKATWINQGEWSDLADLRIHRLSATAAIGLELTRRRWVGTAFVVHNIIETVVGAQGKQRSSSGLTYLNTVILGLPIRDGSQIGLILRIQISRLRWIHSRSSRAIGGGRNRGADVGSVRRRNR